MDRIDQLRIFIRVAHSGSFTLAADQLGLPRPTVSLALQQLEARLGARLLHRTTRRVSLTPDGAALLERAPSLVADVEELEQQFRPDAGPLAGRIRVDMPSRIARRLVAPALPAWLALHPGLQIELGSSDRSIDLVQEGVDCALRVGTPASSSLVARPVGRVRLVNCASPAYLRAHGTPRSLADLPGHRLVHFVNTLGARSAGFEAEVDGALVLTPMQGALTVNNAEAYMAGCLAGLGLIQVPHLGVVDLLARGDLIEVLPQLAAPPMPLTLMYANRRNLPRRVRTVMDWLAQVVATHLERESAAS